MYGESTSKELDAQLSLLYRQECGDLNVTIASIQQQNGGADCGLFAIAVCLSLAVKVDPSKVRWRQMKMRKHFSEIFKSEKIIQFPTIQGKHLNVQMNWHNIQSHYGVFVVYLPMRSTIWLNAQIVKDGIISHAWAPKLSNARGCDVTFK